MNLTFYFKEDNLFSIFQQIVVKGRCDELLAEEHQLLAARFDAIDAVLPRENVVGARLKKKKVLLDYCSRARL
jgi:hypothetical protein